MLALALALALARALVLALALALVRVLALCRVLSVSVEFCFVCWLRAVLYGYCGSCARGCGVM